MSAVEMSGHARNGANDLGRLSASALSFLEAGGRILIDGEWHETGRTLPVVDPSSGRQISTVASAGADAVRDAVQSARQAFHGAWSKVAPQDREKILQRWADLVEENAGLLAELETVDVGMPLWMSRAHDVGGAAAAIRYMAGWPSKIGGLTTSVAMPIPDSEFFGYTRREPVGVVAAIIPWNVPLMLAAWKLAPALAAGCTVVLKPSEDACLSVLLLADLGCKAGLPPGVINVVTGTGPDVGEALVRHPDVDKISFTGSTATGKKIAQMGADTLKKVTLELGGKSPQLLFPDADLDRAIPQIASAIFLNSGQTCVAGSRLYVQRSVFEPVLDRLSAHVQSLPMGPGLDPATIIGPLTTAAQKARVEGYLAGARRDGATLLSRPSQDAWSGFYVQPTIVSDARQAMRIVQEEVFGPVLTVLPFDELDEAVALANDTPYGLSACVWTRSLATAHYVIPRLRCGKVAVNSEPIPYPSLPEGGRKASGYGRDLGEEALLGCLETKSVLIRYC